MNEPSASGLPKRRGLGRGLDALFEDSEKRSGAPAQPTQPMQVRAPAPLSQPTPAVAPGEGAAVGASAPQGQGNGRVFLPVTALEPGLYQPRRKFNDESLAQLAASIAQHGIIQPLLVRPLSGQTGRYEIIAGERRWRAAQRAQLHDVPVIIEPDLSDRSALELGLIENLQREDLNAMDEAAGYQRLVDEFHFTAEKVAEMMGKSRAHIANMLRLLQLPKEVRDLVVAGTLSAGHVRPLIGLPKPMVMAQYILTKKLSVRQTEKWVTSMLKPPRAKKERDGPPLRLARNMADVNMRDLEKLLELTTGLATRVDMMGENSGWVQIEFKNLDQLDEITMRLKDPTFKKREGD